MSRRPVKAKAERPRGDAFGLGLLVLRYIYEQARQPGEIAAAFGISRRTVERILRTAEAKGLDMQVTRRGRGAWYRLGGGEWAGALVARPAGAGAPSPAPPAVRPGRPAGKAAARRRAVRRTRARSS